MGLVRPRSLIRPAVYLDPRRLTSINFIPRVKIDLSLSVLSREVSQLWPWGDPSRWTSIFFVHFLRDTVGPSGIFPARAWNQPLYKEPWHLLWRTEFANQDPGSRCTRWY